MTNHIKARILVAMAVGCLSASGCVAVWGGSYNVALANSRSVVIEFDPAVVNMSSLLQAAQSACDEYGKDAVFDSTDRGNLGIKVNTYRCEVRDPGTIIDVQG